MKILICLFLICAFLVSGVSQILDFDFSVTPPSSGNGSGGETTEPDPEPDPDSVVLSWHQEDCNGHFNYVTSGSCCGDETEFELVIENETPVGFTVTNYSHEDADTGYHDIVTSDDPVNVFHCYVDGACHTCGKVCSHTAGSWESQSIFFEQIGLLDFLHPFYSYTVDTFPYNEGDSMIEDGVCQFCLFDVTQVPEEDPEACSHAYHYIDPVPTCSCGEVFDVVKFSGFSYGEECNYSELGESGNCTECATTYITSLKAIHCYKDGVCHDCGRACNHVANQYENDHLPSDHPLKGKISEGDSLCIDGVCSVCGMTVESTETDTDTVSWHTYGDCAVNCSEPDTLQCTFCYGVISIDDFWKSAYGETFSFGSSFYVDCSSCLETIILDRVHCFENGKCHDCGQICYHQPTCGVDFNYSSRLPKEHPLYNADLKSYDDNGSYVVDGVCQLCGITVE